MQKIPTLFVRDYSTKPPTLTGEVTPGTEWVLAGEGVATVKLDGSSCLIRGGQLFKRYDAKRGKTPPPGFEPAQSEPDEVTGHWPGWLPVTGAPDERWHLEAWNNLLEAAAARDVEVEEGTYELIGPRVQGNPEQLTSHHLYRHGSIAIAPAPRDPEGLRKYLEQHDIEGIVWHHPDGRMVKIKGSDFGLKRGWAR